MPRDLAYLGFVQNRKIVLENAEKGNFLDSFSELCSRAIEGDCIAQDCIAYFFNKGFPDELAPNYDFYMSWLILAGANGNEFSLEKLKFFLEVGINTVIYNEEILKKAIIRKNLTKDNAIVVIGNLICEGIVDQLKLNPKDLINVTTQTSIYSLSKHRKFVKAMEDCIDDVIRFLIS